MGSKLFLEMKVLISILVVLNLCSPASAQLYNCVQYGYFFPIGGAYSSDGLIDYDTVGTQAFNLNKGPATSLFFYHRFNDVLKLRLNVQFSGDGNYTSDFNSFVIEEKERYSTKSLRLEPTFLATAKNKSIEGYVSFGPSIGVFNVVIREISFRDKSTNIVIGNTYSNKGKFSIGLTSSMGVNIHPFKNNKNFFLNSEIRLLATNMKVFKGELIDWADPVTNTPPLAAIDSDVAYPFSGIGIFCGIGYKIL